MLRLVCADDPVASPIGRCAAEAQVGNADFLIPLARLEVIVKRVDRLIN